MPSGKGTYGKTRGRPAKKKKGGKKKKSMGGLTAAQKKLPKALQQAILKRETWQEEEVRLLVKREIFLLIQNFTLE